MQRCKNDLLKHLKNRDNFFLNIKQYFLGIMMSASGIGPLCGAGLAAVCLKIYGDVGKISEQELMM